MTLRRSIRPAQASRICISGFGRRQQRPVGWLLYRVRNELDGRKVDAVEAAVTFADQWWSEHARYLGTSRGYHVYARPPEGVR